jgi:small subunit ribosomal protein S1
VDVETKKISLGMKQLTEDPWSELTNGMTTGLQTLGKITRVVNFGLFVELDNGLEGLVHISEIHGVSSHLDLEKNFRIGDPIQVSILHLDHEARKIALTCKGEPIPSISPHSR